MHYVYLLKISGIKNKNYYIGYTSDLRKRMLEHLSGSTKSTRGRIPELVYYEAFSSQTLAIRRERGLKKSGSVYNALLRRLGLK
jgi:putative endonuclease